MGSYGMCMNCILQCTKQDRNERLFPKSCSQVRVPNNFLNKVILCSKLSFPGSDIILLYHNREAKATTKISQTPRHPPKSKTGHDVEAGDGDLW